MVHLIKQMGKQMIFFTLVFFAIIGILHIVFPNLYAAGDKVLFVLIPMFILLGLFIYYKTKKNVKSIKK